MDIKFNRVKFIVLADDDDDDTMLFVEAVDKLSSAITVSLANDGQQLLNFLDAGNSPDAIFLDLNMPCKNGLECLKSIRQTTNRKQVPIIIYSTSQNKKDIEACYQAGANYYIVKPFDYQDIYSILEKIFSELTAGTITQPPFASFVINTRN